VPIDVRFQSFSHFTNRSLSFDGREPEYTLLHVQVFAIGRITGSVLRSEFEVLRADLLRLSTNTARIEAGEIATQGRFRDLQRRVHVHEVPDPGYIARGDVTLAQDRIRQPRAAGSISLGLGQMPAAYNSTAQRLATVSDSGTHFGQPATPLDSATPHSGQPAGPLHTRPQLNAVAAATATATLAEATETMPDTLKGTSQVSPQPKLRPPM
jgi:hypothetical protein